MNIEYIETQLEEHGELHLVVEEHDAVMADSDEDYIGLRNNNKTEIDKEQGVLKVDVGNTVHVVDADRVVYFHGANSFPD